MERRFDTLVGAQFKTVRRAHGWSQREVEDHMGWPPHAPLCRMREGPAHFGARRQDLVALQLRSRRAARSGLSDPCPVRRLSGSVAVERLDGNVIELGERERFEVLEPAVAGLELRDPALRHVELLSDFGLAELGGPPGSG